jgi:hypothetical protein
VNDRDLFDLVEQISRSEGAGVALDRLIDQLREQKRHQVIFDLRLLQKRQALGLPLVFSGHLSDVPSDRRDEYQAALVEAAREAGRSFLTDGNIERAWYYYRAIGELEPVSEAIERVASADEAERVMAIALLENVNPRKGFELLLEHRGICQGTDFVVKTTERDKRVMFLQMLVRAFYGQLAAHLQEAIADVEGAAATTDRVTELIAGRDWLFEGGRLYIENSHLISILQLSPELPDDETLRLVLELAEYAQHLAPIYQIDGRPPFDNPFIDYAEYLGVLLGEHVEQGLAHFRQKLTDADPATADAFVALLTRAGCYDEAVTVSTAYLHGEAGERCLSAVELCQMAGDDARLRQVAREEGDLVGFAAGILKRAWTTEWQG